MVLLLNFIHHAGHVEVYKFEYTGGAQYFEAACRYFFQFHDPTVLNRQGNDRVSELDVK